MQSILSYLPYRSSIVAAQTCSSHALLAESEGQAGQVPSWYPRRFVRANRRPIERHWTIKRGDRTIAIVPPRDVNNPFDARSLVADGTCDDVPCRPYGVSGNHRFLFLVDEPLVLQHCVEVVIRDTDRYPVDAEKAAAWLKQLTAMTALSCRITRLKSVSFAPTSCPKLIKLDLEQSAVTDDGLRGLEDAPSLRILILSWTSVTNVSCLAASKSLQRIVVTASRVTSEGMLGLEKIPTLEEVVADEAPLTDVARLANSPSLRRLSLSGTQVTSEAVGSLGALGTLQSLCCNECPRVTDVRGLVASISIAELSLRESPVTTEGTCGLERIPSLKKIVLTLTSVEDINHLANSSSLTSIEAEFSLLGPTGAVAFKNRRDVRLLLGNTAAAEQA